MLNRRIRAMETPGLSSSFLSSDPEYVPSPLADLNGSSGFGSDPEHQLLKDHKKVKPKKATPVAATSRRQTPQAETTGGVSTGLPGLVTNVSGVGKTSASDLQSSQNGGGRRTAVKRKAAGDGPRKSLPKGEAKRPPRPRKKATDCNLSKAAVAKWEKEASVGVSLMAEAAEQLERSTTAEVVSPASEASKIHSRSSNGVNLISMDFQTGQIPPGTSVAFSELVLSDQITTELPTGPLVRTLGLGGVPVSSGMSGVSSTSQATCVSAAMPMSAPASQSVLPNTYEGAPGGLVIIPELCSQVKAKSMALDGTRCNNCNTLRCNGPEEGANGTAGTKLKLQLFPFDDYIRKALEQDGHNPHLELTFKARKSISSVLHHLVQKWGRSTVASGDLRLFPFNTQWSNVSTCQSWSFQDLNVSAADVHASLGNPSIFRLRYAWLSDRVLESSSAVLQQQQIHASSGSGPVSFEGDCCPPLRSDSTTQRISDLLQDPITRSAGAGIPTRKSIDQCRPCEQTQLPVSEGACTNEDARHIAPSAIPVHTISGVDVQGAVLSEESVERPSLPPVTESEHSVVAKSSCSNGSPPLPGWLHPGKESAQPASGEASFADKGAENVARSNCKELEHLSQVSGCAWLCESNDGFAQQLWNNEDTLRGGGCVSISQMDWVDSLTNISVSELLGEATRPVFTAPSDVIRPAPRQAQMTSMDSFDTGMTGREPPLSGPMLMSSSHPSTAIFGGDETCDAFSFQRQDRRTKETVNSLVEEISGNSLGLDISFADFRSMACWREGDSLVAFDLAQQPQHRQGQDLLFDGEASIGLGGLIEALAQGSLDEFQACTIDHDAEDRDIDIEIRQGGDFGGQTRASNADGRMELSSKDGSGRETSASFLDLARIDELSNGNGDLFGLYERLPEATLPSVTLPSQDLESLKNARPVNNRSSRKKERRPPQRPFKLPDQYSTPRSLKLQG